MGILIKGGTLIMSDGCSVQDLRIEDDKITEIGVDLPAENCRVIEAKDMLVFPGFIDTHTHLEMNKGLPNETADNWQSGTLAALAGGTTTVLDFAEAPRGASLKSALALWHIRAKGVASCNYGFHMTLKEWTPSVQAELKEMSAEGVTSYKIYMAYENLRVDDETALNILKGVAAEGGIVGCHCEDGDLVATGIKSCVEKGHLDVTAHPASRPPEVESIAVKRWLDLANQARVAVNVVHLSTKNGLEVIRDARKKGQRVFVETCPQYLLLNEEKYNLPDFEGAKYVLSPPLREQSHADALWKAVENEEIDTIGTDHCSFMFKKVKELGKHDFSKIPNGMPGVEHRPLLMYSEGVHTGRITPLLLAKLLSEQPAKVFGMYPQKGVLSVGSDADITVIDPCKKSCITAEKQHQAVDYTPYEGWYLNGGIDTVILNGEVAVESGKVILEKKGRYVSRKP